MISRKNSVLGATGIVESISLSPCRISLPSSMTSALLVGEGQKVVTISQAHVHINYTVHSVFVNIYTYI